MPTETEKAPSSRWLWALFHKILLILLKEEFH